MTIRSKLTLVLLVVGVAILLLITIFVTNSLDSRLRSQVGNNVSILAIDTTIDDIRLHVLIGGAILLGVVLLVSWTVSSRFSKRIRGVALVAEEIRAGALERRIPVDGKDELGHLEDSMNAMVDKLNEDISKLKKLERIRTEFLGNVSHELRTPIFAIQGMLETLLHGGLDDRNISRDFIDRSLNNTQRLNTLLSDLIEISRIESGDMKMSFRYFSLKDFVAQVISEINPLAEQKHIRISTHDIPNDIEVMGDKERLKQAVLNLLDNAIKYTPAEGVVQIGIAKAEENVRLSVTDNGIGIAEEHLPRIFERFYRVDKERSREVGGTGLGLAIVKHIIEAHGSKIEVESKVGQGSTFSFTMKT
jgi:two-component system phosphate regulon sensor histidine kinase PhoR